MTRTPTRTGLALGLWAAAWGISAPAAETWGLNIYGLSYHWERDVAKRNGWDNEINPGLGLRYSGGPLGRGNWFMDGGVYRDSGRNTAVYGGAGWRIPLDDARRWRLGAALVAFHSDTYNRGAPFVAPVPLLSYDLGGLTLNLSHFLKVRDFNDVNTTAFFVTLPLR